MFLSQICCLDKSFRSTNLLSIRSIDLLAVDIQSVCILTNAVVFFAVVTDADIFTITKLLHVCHQYVWHIWLLLIATLYFVHRDYIFIGNVLSSVITKYVFYLRLFGKHNLLSIFTEDSGKKNFFFLTFYHI